MSSAMRCFVLPYSNVGISRRGTHRRETFVTSTRVTQKRVANQRRRCVGSRVSMEAAPSVQELLKAEDILNRIRGINRIGELGSTSDMASALIPLATKDAHPQVRYSAISRISNLDREQLSEDDKGGILEAIRFVLLKDTESSNQSAAADVIAGLGISEGFDDLVDMFHKTSDWMLKFSITAGMGEMADPKAYDFLASVLEKVEDQDVLLTSAALGAIGELGDERGISLIERFLECEDSSIRHRAKIAHDMLVKKET